MFDECESSLLKMSNCSVERLLVVEHAGSPVHFLGPQIGQQGFEGNPADEASGAVGVI